MGQVPQKEAIMAKDKEADAAYHRQLWRERKESGLCVICGKNPQSNERLCCASCTKGRKPYEAAWARHRRRIWRDSGLCVECGGERDSKYLACVRCRLERLRYWRADRQN